MVECKLGEILKIQQGFAFKSSNYVAKSNVALVTLGNFTNNNDFKFNKEKTTYYGVDYPREYNLNEGDLIIPMTEQVIGLFGNTAFVPKIDKIQFVLNQRVGKIIINENKADKKFIHYLLSTELVRSQLEHRASGTKQRNISSDNIYDVTVYLPSLNIQKKIGNLLYTLELKINNNNKINNNLEDMAFEIYMHSFFKKEKNGELGNIIIENQKSNVQVGQAKDKKGIYPFFTSGDSVLEWDDLMVDGRNLYLNTGGNSDVKFYVGKAAYSTDTWCITAKENMADYLYLMLKSIKEELNKKFFQGSGLKHLQKPLLKREKIYIPSKEEIIKFNNQVQPLFNMVASNIRETQHLIELRDYLLPMLMNGQINVDDVKI